MPQRPAFDAKLLHRAFELGVTAKAIFATVETLCGVGLFFLNAGWLQKAARWLTASELSEDPGDRISHLILNAAQHYSISGQHFWAVYLIGHGGIKLVAVAALLARVLWAYPLSIAVLVGFILWQMQKWVITHSALMLGLSLFDVIVIWLIWQEYKSLRRQS